MHSSYTIFEKLQSLTEEELAEIKSNPNLLNFKGIEEIQLPKIKSEQLNPEFPESILMYFIKLDSLEFTNLKDYIIAQHQKALKYIEDFKIVPLERLQGNEKELYIENVKLIYHSTCLFPCVETKLFLKKAGLLDSHLVWFHDLNSITEEFDKIIENGTIIFLKGKALLGIYLYLLARIELEIADWIGTVKEDYNGRKFTTKNYIKKEYFIKDTKGDIYSLFESNESELRYIKMLHKFIGELNMKNILLELPDGDITSFTLGSVIELCREFSKIKNINELYRPFYDLFKPLLEYKNRRAKAYIFKDDKEFDFENKKGQVEIKYLIDKSGVKIYLNTYKAKRMKEIFGRGNTIISTLKNNSELEK